MLPRLAVAVPVRSASDRPGASRCCCLSLLLLPRLQGEVLTGTGGLTQFQLLEASEPTQAARGAPGAPADHLNKQTLAFVRCAA